LVSEQEDSWPKKDEKKKKVHPGEKKPETCRGEVGGKKRYRAGWGGAGES